MWRIVALLIAAAGVAQAGGGKELIDHLSHCNKESEIAEAIMGSRQHGTPLSDVMPFLIGKPTHEALAIDAYRVEIGISKDERTKIKQSFRDKVYMECYQSIPDSVKPKPSHKQ